MRTQNDQQESTASLIEGIPTEILLAIFVQCQPPEAEPRPGKQIQGSAAPEWHFGDEWQVNLGGVSTKDSYFWWTAVTQVCSRWRQVALGDPALWKSIHLQPSCQCPGSLATTFFERSHPLPIELYHQKDEELPTGRYSDREESRVVGGDEEDGHDAVRTQVGVSPPISQEEEELLDAFYDSLIQYPDRIASLHLGVAFHPKLWKLVDLPMLNLATVQLKSGQPPEFPSEDAPGFVSFSANTAANIQQLSLCNYLFPLYGFSRLTHLYLSNEWSGPSGYAVIDDLLDLLHDVSSTLVVFCFGDAGSSSADTRRPLTFTPRRGRKAIHMRSLQYAEVVSFASYTFYPLLFLHSLTLPDTVEIAWIHYAYDDDESLKHLAEDLYFLLPPPACLDHVTTVIVHGEREPSYIVKEHAVRISGSAFCCDDATLALQRYVTTLRTLVVDVAAEQLQNQLELESMARMMFGFQSMENLHIRSSSTLLPTLLRLLDSGIIPDTVEGAVPLSSIWPNLSTIVVYLDANQPQALQDQLELQLSAPASLRRSRSGGKSYVLKVETKSMDPQLLGSAV